MIQERDPQPFLSLTRRDFLTRLAAGAVLVPPMLRVHLMAQAAGPGNMPIPEPHFPARIFLYVWRNWELANTDRIAKVAGASEAEVLNVGRSMGLARKPRLTEDQLRRIYITTIRQNWHALPDEQIIELLGWDRAQYEFTLKEDDFLWHKLGPKPKCEKLAYSKPAERELKRAAEIKAFAKSFFGSGLEAKGEPPFHFISDLSGTKPPFRIGGGKRVIKGKEIALLDCVVVEPGQPEARTAVKQWTGRVKATFGTKLKIVSDSTPLLRRTLRFTFEAQAGAAKEAYHLAVNDQGVNVRVVSIAALRAALNLMLDLCEEREAAILPYGRWERSSLVQPRYIYPYFALYGDPLLDSTIDPFPAGYLEKLGRCGVDGVWIQAVLRNLAPSATFPEFGKDWEVRLANLKKFTARAKEHGLKIFLYINEPRTMTREFFAKYPEARGTSHGAPPESAREFAMCTSVPEVRAWLRDSLAHVFSRVPELGGIFTITASENLTNCFAHGQARNCPRCSRRQGWEVVTELLETFRDGVHKGNPSAEVIAWDWGWGWVKNGPDPAPTIAHMPKGVRLLSVSEWGKPYTRAGVALSVGEYSISVVGPGDRALNNWRIARENNVPIMAKVAFNNTWEISAVPYIPVPALIAEHMKNLAAEKVGGLMLSWTLGGYPSPNLQVAREFYQAPQPSEKEVLVRVAARRYGRAAAPGIVSAWETFSAAFRQFPYGVVPPYVVPTQHGPSNLLRATPTGYRASMILFPHDDLKAWMGPYKPAAAREQFEKMTASWEEGLDQFRSALAAVPKARLAQARKDLGIAETCAIHFRSVANQIRFYELREQLNQQSGAERAACIGRMKDIARDEMDLSRKLFRIARDDSRIGYEASNHYYYRPMDLIEKALNCELLIRALT